MPNFVFLPSLSISTLPTSYLYLWHVFEAAVQRRRGDSESESSSAAGEGSQSYTATGERPLPYTAAGEGSRKSSKSHMIPALHQAARDASQRSGKNLEETSLENINVNPMMGTDLRERKLKEIDHHSSGKLAGEGETVSREKTRTTRADTLQ